MPAPAITSENWGDWGVLGYSLVSGRCCFFKDMYFSGLRRNITSPVGQYRETAPAVYDDPVFASSLPACSRYCFAIRVDFFKMERS